MINFPKYQLHPAPEPVKTEKSPSSGLEWNCGGSEEVSGKKNLLEKANSIRKFLLPVKAMVLVMIFLFSAYVAQAAPRTASVTGNWNATATWGGATVPTASDAVTINSGITVTVTATATCLSITNNGILTTTTYGITVAGPWVNNGTFNAGTGTVTFSGATAAINAGTGTANFNIIAPALAATTLAVNTNTTCSALTFGASTATTAVNIASGITLTVSGAVTIPRATTMNTLAVGAGTLNAGSIAFTAGGGTNRHQITITTGTVTVTGNVTGVGGVSPTIAFTGAGFLKLGGALFTSTTGTLTTFAGSTVEYNGSIAQTVQTFNYANLTISGSNTKTLAAATPTVNGALTVKAGTTLALSTFALGATTAPTSVVMEIGTTGSIISGSGILNLGGNVTVNDITGASGATISCPIALDGARTFTVADDGSSATDLSISGVMSLGTGTGWGIVKAGAGTMVLSRANTYTGLTTVSTGVLNIQNAQGTGTIAGGVTVTSGAALQLQGGITVGAEVLTLNGTGISNDGALRSISGANIWGGTVTLGSASIIQSDAGSLTLNAANSITATNQNLTLQGAVGGTISGTITTGSGTLTKAGAGTWTLSGVNTYTGATSVNGGTLAAGVITQAFGVGSAVTLANTAGVILTISGFNNTIGSLTGGGATGGNVTLGVNTLTIGSDNSNPAAYAGVISGTGAITKSGTGTLTLSGTNTYTGATNVSAGVLNIQNAQGTGTIAGGVTVASGAALELQGGITVGAETLSLNNVGISSGGALRNISGTNSWAGAITLVAASRINSNAGTLTLSGGVSGGFNLTVGGANNTTFGTVAIAITGTLTKDGAGTLTMNFANTYTGTTTVNAGALTYGVANALLTGGLTIDGATAVMNMLNYSDVVGTVTVDNGGSITSSTGVLTSTGTFEMKSGSVSAILGGSAIPLNKTTTGTVILSGANTYTGATTITLGELRLNPSADITPNTQIVLNGGKLSTTGITAARTIINSSTLNLNANSSIDLGSNAHSLKFANSNAIAWAGTTLTINGWTGTAGSSGTAGKIFFGAGTGTLTAGQLAKISFTGYSGTPILLGTGELVPPGPVLAITGSPTNHGNSCIGIAATPVTYTITNTGATATGVSVTSNNSQFVVSGAPTTVTGGGGTATYVVTFTPSGSGAQSATITVASTTTGSNSPTSSLSGTGNPPIGNNAIDFTNGQHGTICGTAPENGNAGLTAPSGTVFINVGFASYGTPTGTCPTFTLGSCHALTSQTVTEGYLLGNNTASIPATNGIFGDPCSGTVKSLYVMATYTEPICAGSTPAALTGTLPTGGSGSYVYLWESSTTSAVAGFATASGTSNTQNYTPGSLTQTTWYRRTVTSGGCSNTATAIQITVNPVIANNTISSAQSICTGTTPAGLTGTLPTGGSGSYVYLWESSTTSGVAGLATATGTSNAQNYTPGSLTQTTWYRRTVTSGGCSNTATAIQITVNPVIANNTVSAAQSICTGTTPAGLTGTLPTGGSGSYVYLWESSTTSGVAGFATATGTSNAQNYTPGSLTQTTWYRRTVTSGGCSNTATAIQITVNPVIADNTVSTAQTICSGATPAGLTGTTPTGGNTTYVYLWESSTTSGVAGFATATGTSNTQNYTPGSLTQTTWYRRTVTSGGCSDIASAIQITVNQLPTITGQPASPAAVCSGTNSSTFTVAATGTGLNYQWQRGISGTYVNITGGTTPNDGCTYSGYTGATLTITDAVSGMNGYTYRCVVSGTCTPSATSNGSATLTFSTAPVITVQPASPTAVCSGTNASTFTVAATGTGLTYQWQRGISGAYTNITAGTTPNDGCTYSGYTGVTLTVTNAPSGMNGNTYRCVISSGACSSTSNGNATLTVNTAPAITGQPASPATVIAGTNSSTFTVTATGLGLTYQWQRGITGTYTNITAGTTPNDGCTYSGYTGATLTVTNAPLGMNGYTYRCVVSGTCTPSVTSNGAATLNVTSSSCITTQPSSVTICTGVNTSFAVVATGSPAYQWQVSTNGGGTYTDITAAGTDPVYSNYTTATLGIAPTNPSMDGYKYRCRLTGGCAQISSAATLTLRIINISYKLSASPDLLDASGGAVRNSTLTLSGSQTSVNYQLRTGTTPIGSTVAGTGGSISFAAVSPTVSTQYNVLATTATGGCSAQITDTKGVTVNETGIIISLTTCNGQPGLNFFTNSNFGTTATNNYQTPDQGLFPGVILGNPLGAYTNYTYGLVSNAIPDGNYVIANSTAGMYRAPQQIMGTDVWLYTEDRSSTPGTGHMYIVNASNTPGEFYTETLSNLCEKTRYEFRADVINLYAANWVPNGPDYLSYFPVDGQGNRYSILPNVDFMIDGKVALNTGDIMNDGSWKTFGFTFRTAPGQTSISFTMRNNSTGGIGNDLALDNIIMRVCGPVIDIKIVTTEPVCAGQPVTMTVNLIAVDYEDPKYQWQKSTDNGVTWNDIPGETGTSYTNNNPTEGEMYRYKVAETVASLSSPNCSVASNAVSIPATAGILSTTPGSRCQAGTVTLGATASSGATINWYDASSGGNLVGTGTSFTTPSISTTTTYYVEAINSACPAVRMPVVATINPIVTADVTISASTGNSICSSTSVTFTATPTNGGATPSYQWKLNGANIGTNSPTYTTTTLVNSDAVTCVMTSSIASCIAGSPATSNTITMTVGASVVASVSISANPGSTICQSTSVTFTAVPVNGGSTPTYQWKKNTVDIPSELANTYTTSSLAQGDVITCVMTTSLGCATGSPATSNGITMTVYNTLTAGISGGSSPICYNTAPGTFTATGGGGTGSYTYLWYKDGLTTGVTTQTYAPGNLTATSTFYCAITSGICGTVNTSTTTITVTALPTATIIYSGTPFCTTISTAQPITLNGTGAYTGGTYGSTAGLTIDIGTGAVIPSTSTPGTYTVTYTIPASGGCGIVTVTTPVTINLDGSWTGSLSTDWNTPGNWACNQLPTLTTDVIIANGKPNYPTLSTGSPGMSRNLTIGSSSSVTVTGNILQIAGSITNSGTLFTATAGTVEMKGSGAQTIGANVFAGNTIMNLTINNSAGVTLQGPLSVTGIVSTTAGILSSGGNLTLVSTASQTALIDGTGTGSVTGNVTMQRYLSSAFGYKYFSSPFTDATVAQFANHLDLTDPTTHFPNFYAYDEDNHRDSSNSVAYMSGWVSYLAGSLSPMSGYAANFGSASSAKTVSITGTVNNGSKSVTLYNHNRKYTKGFNLVGNPYPSPIDWDAASGWTRTNIDAAIYFFSASGTQYTGTYSSYVNGAGGGNNIIPSMQGFFVHVTNGTYPVTATLGMNNGVRMNGLSSGFHKSGYSSDTRPIIRLTAGYADEKNPADPVVIYFDEKATVEFDSKLDALKLMNTDVKVPNFYALSSDANQLSINAIPYPDSMSVVPLGLRTEQAGWIFFRATGIENMPPGLQIYFLDNKTGIYTDLLQTTGLRLNMSAGTEENRFSLIFSNRKLSDTQGLNDAFVVYSSGGKLIVSFTGSEGEKGDLVINNMIGQELWRQQIIGTGIHEFDPQVKTGVYVVSFYSGKSIYSKKVLIANQ